MILENISLRETSYKKGDMEECKRGRKRQVKSLCTQKNVSRRLLRDFLQPLHLLLYLFIAFSFLRLWFSRENDIPYSFPCPSFWLSYINIWYIPRLSRQSILSFRFCLSSLLLKDFFPHEFLQKGSRNDGKETSIYYSNLDSAIKWRLDFLKHETELLQNRSCSKKGSNFARKEKRKKSCFQSKRITKDLRG